MPEKKQAGNTPAFIPAANLFKDQWYLKAGRAKQLVPEADVCAEKAWDITKGNRKIVVAIIDTDFDLNFPALNQPGKIVYAKDYVNGKHNPFPAGKNYSTHGTLCATIAVGEDNSMGIKGIAPGCLLMPVRISLESDDDVLMNIFTETASRADIISCSWGPVPGYAPLSAPLFNCIKKLVKTGGPRGKGCVICFSANNYNAKVNDPYNKNFLWMDSRTNNFRTTKGPILNGYAAHPAVIAVSASTSLNKKALYSNWGKEISVCGPSNNYHPFGITFSVEGRRYIWTNTNEGNMHLGGTSSAAPLVAGIAALVLSANPYLTGAQVKTILQKTADKITDKEPDKISGRCWGHYIKGHSKWFGYGKVNAAAAVCMAKKMLAGNIPKK